MNRKNYFFVLVSYFFLVTIISCSQSTSSKLVGEWQLVKDSISCTNPLIDSLNAAQKGTFQSGEALLIQQSKNHVLEGESFSFKKDDTYEQTSGKLRFAGDYKVVKDSGLVLTGLMNMVMDVYTINSISKDSLKMTHSFSMQDHSHSEVQCFYKKK